MNTKAQQNSGDILKYAAAVLLVAGGLFGFYWFDQWPGGIRALLVAGGLILGAAVFLVSHKGVQTREFLSESHFELRKVVWPTRQEAMRTTWVVVLAVVVLSLILAGFDVVIQAAVKWLLGR